MSAEEQLLELASPEELAELGSFDVPSPERARYLLRELGWEERFEGMDVNAAAGECTLRFYSLKEVAKIYRFGTAGLGFTLGGSGSISVSNPDDVVDWVRNAVEDDVLADALERDLEKEGSYHDCARVISRLLNMRYTELASLAQKDA